MDISIKIWPNQVNNLDFYANYPTPLLCATLTIGAAACNPNYRGSRMHLPKNGCKFTARAEETLKILRFYFDRGLLCHHSEKIY